MEIEFGRTKPKTPMISERPGRAWERPRAAAAKAAPASGTAGAFRLRHARRLQPRLYHK